VLEETKETEELIARVAALDIGKQELVCCIRVPGAGRRGKRLQKVGTYQTMTRSLLVLADRLRELGVTRVVMGDVPRRGVSGRRAGSASGVYAGISWAGATSLVVAVSRAMEPSER
jgi:hypothetical protein